VVVEPPPDVPCRYAVLFVPPAGDEMNKSRRMSALQARAFALHGATVALLDLRGTGESAGEHRDATWDGWREDVGFAWDWLGRTGSVPRVLWGTRLGGLLAADLVADRAIDPEALLLWQPVASGTAFFNQWLRIASAQQLTGRSDRADAGSLRRALTSGQHVEVGGYELNPSLVSGAEAVNLAELDVGCSMVVWREVSPADPPSLSPAADNVANAWMASGTRVDIAPIVGASFWASQEIAEVPALVTATTHAMGHWLLQEARS